MAFNSCFVCLADLGRRGVGVGTKVIRGRNPVKFLLNYLLHTKTGRFAGLLNQLLELSGGSGVEGGHAEGRKLLRMCDKCEGMAGKVLELQLELDKVEMRIVHEVRRVRRRIMEGAGWLDGLGEEGNNEVEALANFSRRFCGGKSSPKVRQLFRTLKGFQSAVYKTEKDSIHVPLVRLKQCNAFPNQDALIMEVEHIPDFLAPVKFELFEDGEETPVDPLLMENDFILDADDDNDDDDGGDGDANWTPNLDDDEDDAYFEADMEPEVAHAQFIPATSVSSTSRSRPSRSSAAVARSRISQLQDEQEERRGRPERKWKKLVKNATTATRPKPKPKPTSSISGFGSGEEKKVGLTRKKVYLPNGSISADLQLACESCDFTHANQYRFEHHMRSHEVEEEKQFHCEDCNQGFSTEQHYRFHQGQHANMHKLKCDVCKVAVPAFRISEHLKRHEDVLEVFPCPNCSHVSSSIGKRCEHNLSNHFIETEPKCEICGESFPGKWELMDHLEKVHQVIEMLKCDVAGCAKTFTRSDHMLRHFREKHKKFYRCEDCKKNFGVKKNLEAHRQEVHASKTPNSCRVCEVVILSKHTMRGHMIKEHGAPKLECRICGKEYMNRDGLKFHMIRFHKDGSGVDCPHCDKKFVSEYKLKLHLDVKHGIGIRRNFVCEVCGKAYKTAPACKKHKETHGEPTFQCSVCPKAFFQSQGLKLHMMVHTGEKPYACEYCGLEFRQSSHFKAHKNKCQLKAEQEQERGQE